MRLKIPVIGILLALLPASDTFNPALLVARVVAVAFVGSVNRVAG